MATLMTSVAAAAKLTILTPIHLPAVTVGAPINFAFSATGGTGAYFWRANGGFPPALTISPSGVLTGRIIKTGPIYFSVQVTDASHTTTTQNFSLQVVDVR
jgi:hypothetical protein